MVDIIRNKWCDDLEEIIQCPICMTRPKGSIRQCVQGHHICEDCKNQLSNCPTCSQRWCTLRNRLAENLCAKLDDIKISLIDPHGEINRCAIPNKVSVGSQTDGSLAAAVDPPPKKTPNEHAGAYPCRIGACSVTLSFTPLMKHIQTDHSTQYLELEMGDAAVFQHTWPVDYKEQMTMDHAFHVPSMGIFFLKLSSDVFGNFTGFILMLHNGFISKRFTYQLEVSCCREHACAAYTGEVCSCRTPADVLKQKSLQVSRMEMCRMTNHEKQLKCTVLLGKKPQTDEAERPNNQQQRNRNPRNRNNDAGRGRGRGQQPSEGHSMGPRAPPRSMNNRQSRPQTASNGPPPPPLFGVLPPQGRPVYHAPRFRSTNRPILNGASSISSLPALYPDLHDF